MSGLVEIICSACGADALLRREPVYEGFKRTGERLLCSACGHTFADEGDVPFKTQRKASIFTDDERPRDINVFDDDERGRNCRYCAHYVVNPFTQRCGLHEKAVQATDTCLDFERAEEADEDA